MVKDTTGSRRAEKRKRRRTKTRRKMKKRRKGTMVQTARGGNTESKKIGRVAPEAAPGAKRPRRRATEAERLRGEAAGVKRPVF